jgi:PAS domain S-box-containing protein
LENCREALQEILNGGLKGCFVEMNSCEGGCVGGPSFRKRSHARLNGRIKIEKSAGCDYGCDFNIKSDLPLERTLHPTEVYKPQPSERQIMSILRKMGKRSAEDELNCGMCGYSSCREKARAVFEGKAEISMCLPFMKERAESLSDSILDLTPNAIVAVDTDLKVQQINAAACAIFGISAEEATGKPVSEILDEFDFVDMLTNEKTAMTKHAYLADRGVYLEQEFRFDKSCGTVICVMKNITQSRQRKNNLKKAKVQAANMADEIVEKQLSVVHEIAALLGETAAETQAAVHNLKATIMIDSEDD